MEEDELEALDDKERAPKAPALGVFANAELLFPELEEDELDALAALDDEDEVDAEEDEEDDQKFGETLAHAMDGGRTKKAYKMIPLVRKNRAERNR